MCAHIGTIHRQLMIVPHSIVLFVLHPIIRSSSCEDGHCEKESDKEEDATKPPVKVLQNILVGPAKAVISESNFLNENLATEIINDIIGMAVHESKTQKIPEQIRKRKRFSVSLEDRKKQRLEGKNNDRVIRGVLIQSDTSNLKAEKSRQGKHSPPNKIDRAVIRQHTETFQPSVSHYRREQAPNRREVVSEMNVSFAALGHEECLAYEKFKNHKQTITTTPKLWKMTAKTVVHIDKANSARKQYQINAKASDPHTLACSADFQKYFEPGHTFMSADAFQKLVLM
ncbi:hypothetical protein ILUMI_22599 [Ignelater luminosus]|uniref:Uncharacterized protein n=1 Tax=Ignelater luminosus TaxID=2038154 RepID=A0A8K0CDJ8_IGNLU|nr:hypothetical protein ILUMI_22599 [Ignelater luminosus]